MSESSLHAQHTMKDQRWRASTQEAFYEWMSEQMNQQCVVVNLSLSIIVYIDLGLPPLPAQTQ